MFLCRYVCIRLLRKSSRVLTFNFKCTDLRSIQNLLAKLGTIIITSAKGKQFYLSQLGKILQVIKKFEAFLGSSDFQSSERIGRVLGHYSSGLLAGLFNIEVAISKSFLNNQIYHESSIED